MAVRDVPVVTLKKIVDAPPADARISAARVLFPPTEASVRTINSFWTSANEEPTRTVKCASGPSCGMDIDGKAQVERMIDRFPQVETVLSSPMPCSPGTPQREAKSRLHMPFVERLRRPY